MKKTKKSESNTQPEPFQPESEKALPLRQSDTLNETLALMPAPTLEFVGTFSKEEKAKLIADQSRLRQVFYTRDGNGSDPTLFTLPFPDGVKTVPGGHQFLKHSDLLPLPSWRLLWSFLQNSNEDIFAEWEATNLKLINTTVKPGVYAVFTDKGSIQVNFVNLMGGHTASSTLKLAIGLFSSRPFNLNISLKIKKASYSVSSVKFSNSLYYADKVCVLRAISEEVSVNWTVQRFPGDTGDTSVTLRSFDISRSVFKL